MAFDGEVFNRLGLPPYAGALARELQNLADGLTTLNTNGGGFTLHQGAGAPDVGPGQRRRLVSKHHRRIVVRQSNRVPGSSDTPTNWALQGPMTE